MSVGAGPEDIDRLIPALEKNAASSERQTNAVIWLTLALVVLGIAGLIEGLLLALAQ